jgi:hypothetical protein
VQLQWSLYTTSSSGPDARLLQPEKKKEDFLHCLLEIRLGVPIKSNNKIKYNDSATLQMKANHSQTNSCVPGYQLLVQTQQ